MSHTPGPWRVNETPQSSNQNWVVLDSAPGHHKRVCAVYSSNDEADARLIAEAPAMLAALHEGRRAIGDHFRPDDCYATGPLTGDPLRDLVQCPACAFIAAYNATIARIEGRS